MLELIRPWTRELPEDAFQLVRAGDYTFRAQVADRWRDRRAFLLGDAAHLTPPFIGQGLGAGLRDAANLSWKLAGVLAGGFDDTCLDTYELERKAHSTAMIRLAVRLGTAMTAGGRRTELLRRAILPRLSLFPGLRARAVDSATPRLVRSAFARRSVRHPFLGGALCPNADPVRAFSRKAGRASEIAGHPIRTGDRVLVLYASANRDERVWADPDAFDVTRKCCHQLGFGQARTGARVRAWDAWRRRPCWWSCWLPSNASS